jgi:hypothetical protein
MPRIANPYTSEASALGLANESSAKPRRPPTQVGSKPVSSALTGLDTNLPAQDLAASHNSPRWPSSAFSAVLGCAKRGAARARASSVSRHRCEGRVPATSSSHGMSSFEADEESTFPNFIKWPDRCRLRSQCRAFALTNTTASDDAAGSPGAAERQGRPVSSSWQANEARPKKLVRSDNLARFGFRRCSSAKQRQLHSASTPSRLITSQPTRPVGTSF